MMDVLDRLDQWAEREDALVMLTRRGDLTRPAPEEWTAVLTVEAGQYVGYAMSPGLAIERALENVTAGALA